MCDVITVRTKRSLVQSAETFGPDMLDRPMRPHNEGLCPTMVGKARQVKRKLDENEVPLFNSRGLLEAARNC